VDVKVFPSEANILNHKFSLAEKFLAQSSDLVFITDTVVDTVS